MSLSKKTRFEVLKRDRFRCRYCGAAAPEVLLQVDHVNPIAAGGTDDLLNLVAACIACNAGKSDRKLDDISAVESSRVQAEELQERREQIQMIADWHSSLANEEDFTRKQVEAYLPTIREPNDNGRKKLDTWIRRYGLDEVIESTRRSFEQYFQEGSCEESTAESWERAFNMIGRILSVRAIEKKDPALAEAYKLRGILRKRFHTYIDMPKALDYLAALVDEGCTDEARSICYEARNWTSFTTLADQVLDKARRGVRPDA